ncbi:uncharacterized protein SAZU_5653 [Streptomyces azureus]|uniref:Uncharacterized protein n=1 Tax=Streptomyces azureus TaxID=146537 RepID=A0A0K8PTM0_STRAJ|nr:uncharacterized protein SAZU_5653 [Streptomyces azureus]
MSTHYYSSSVAPQRSSISLCQVGDTCNGISDRPQSVYESESGRIDIVDGIAARIKVRILLLGVGLGEAAEGGVVVAVPHLVQARRVQVGAGVAVRLGGGRESVDKARAARGETGDADSQEAPATPGKKATVRKTPGKATARAASSRNAGRSGDRRGTPAR